MEDNVKKENNHKKKLTIIISSVISVLVIVGTVLGIVFGVKACKGKDNVVEISMTREEFVKEFGKRTIFNKGIDELPNKVHVTGTMKEDSVSEEFNSVFNLKLEPYDKNSLHIEGISQIDEMLNISATGDVINEWIDGITSLYALYGDPVSFTYKSLGENLIITYEAKHKNNHFTTKIEYDKEALVTSYYTNYDDNSTTYDLKFSNYIKEA